MSLWWADLLCGRIFLAVVDFIATPFRNGWNPVKKLFGIWGNDSPSLKDKIKETFETVVKFVSEPSEKAFKAIEKAFDKVMNWIRRVDFGMPPPQ